MSVITMFSLTAPNLEQRLRDGGYVHEDIMHVRGNREVKTEVLDYRLCNPDLESDFRTENAERGWKKWNPDTKDYDIQEYTEQQLDELSKYPVTFSEDGNTLQWMSNYAINGTPAKFVTTLYPDEIMELRAMQETSLVESCYLQNDHACLPDGTKVEDKIARVSDKQIKDMGNGSMRVSLPVSVDDKRFAYLYVKENEVQPFDLANLNNPRKNICFTGENSLVDVYRVLSTGEKVKQTMERDMLIKMHNNAVNDYEMRREQAYSGKAVQNDVPKKDIEVAKAMGAYVPIFKDAIRPLRGQEGQSHASVGMTINGEKRYGELFFKDSDVSVSRTNKDLMILTLDREKSYNVGFKEEGNPKLKYEKMTGEDIAHAHGEYIADKKPGRALPTVADNMENDGVSDEYDGSHL